MEKGPKIELPSKPQESVVETWKNEGNLVKAEKSSQREKILKKLRTQKKEKMSLLHSAIQNLDQGEPVDEFGDETRIIVYFDEKKQQYFVDRDGSRRNIGLGDITSDYAWNIKYIPDGEMTEPAYRTLAKRILANEARRDIEQLYDRELTKVYQSTELSIRQPLAHIERQWKKWEHGSRGEGAMFIGMVAETTVRELLNRIALNNKLDFAVLRANAIEDNIYKYDFKIRVYQRNRGVVIKQEDTEKTSSKKGETGIQFGLVKPRYARKKARTIEGIKEKFSKKLPVNDIVLITIQTKEFAYAFNKWLSNDKPPGGPEQFLSRDLKMGILKAVTKDLIEISEKEIEKIFPT